MTPSVDRPMDDLAIIIVSTNEAHWLRPCLRTIIDGAGDISLDVVVADNQSSDGTRALVEQEFPAFRVVTCENRGFAHANNRGLMTCNARYVLFLNPDTEILEGTFEELVRALDERPGVGLVGVRQVTADGELFPTIRRFPNALRAFGEAFGSERWGHGATWLGERELRMERYEEEVECDWTSGSFMLARREALESAGFMDERSFIYSEEPDLCLRMRKAGWQIRHLLEPICREGRLPSMLTAGEYRDMAKRAGFRCVRYRDISQSVARTWSICFRRFLHAMVIDPAMRHHQHKPCQIGQMADFRHSTGL